MMKMAKMLGLWKVPVALGTLPPRAVMTFTGRWNWPVTTW